MSTSQTEDLVQLLAEVSRALAEHLIPENTEDQELAVEVDGQYIGDFIIPADAGKPDYSLMERIRVALGEHGEVSGTAEQGFIVR